MNTVKYYRPLFDSQTQPLDAKYFSITLKHTYRFYYVIT